MNLRFIGIILVLCGTAFGCSTKETLDTRGDAIRLGVSSVTRTVINDLDGLRSVGDNIGIYGVRTSGHTSGSGEDWSNAPFSDEAVDGGTVIMKNVRRLLSVRMGRSIGMADIIIRSTKMPA